MNSLKDNLNYAITQHCAFGTSKHADKQQGSNSNHIKIYSLEDARGLRDTAKNFANFMKEHYPEITKIKQVEERHVQHWIDTRSVNWSNNTKQCHQSHMEKINRLVKDTYKSCKKDFTKNLDYHIVKHEKDDKVRDIDMSREDFDRLKASFENSRSQASLGIRLAESLGLRALEVVSFRTSYIDLENNVVHLPASSESGTKGARARDIEIQDKYRDLFEFIVNTVGVHDRKLFTINEDSYNTTIRRHLKNLDLSEKYKDTTNHAIRKMWAKELYNTYLEKGYPDSLDTFNYVSVQLGHGENRDDLYRTYIVK